MKYTNEWLLAELSSGKEFNYVYFWGHRPAVDGSITKTCLSQWFAAGFTMDGQYFPTAEHWMMWNKAMTFNDLTTAEAILKNKDPRKAKSWGRRVKDYDNEKWAAVKFDIVVRGNVAKFTQQPRLGAYLRGTGDKVLVEASPYDAQWGIGMLQEEAQRV
ncbi:MAG: NADAR family protein, partial [Bacteroidota bacterium]